MQNQLKKEKYNLPIEEGLFIDFFDSLVNQNFNEQNSQDYFNAKEYYINNNSLSNFSNNMHKNILLFIKNINCYTDQHNAYLWQEFFIKNENISPVTFIRNGYENIPLVAFFMETEKPIFNSIYEQLRQHKDWDSNIILGSEYVMAKLVEFKNKDFLTCIQQTGFQITDNTPQIYWNRGDKEILKFIFESRLLDPHREDSNNVAQEVFRSMLKKSTNFQEIQDSMNFFENMAVKPDTQTLNFLSIILNKEYSNSENKENVFQSSYFFYYFNQNDNHMIYNSDLAVNYMITDLLDSDEDEKDNEETIKIIVSFLKDKGVYPDWSSFHEFYSTIGKYYSSDGEELQFLKNILIHNSKEYLNEKINTDDIINNNKKLRL